MPGGRLLFRDWGFFPQRVGFFLSYRCSPPDADRHRVAAGFWLWRGLSGYRGIITHGLAASISGWSPLGVLGASGPTLNCGRRRIVWHASGRRAMTRAPILKLIRPKFEFEPHDPRNPRHLPLTPASSATRSPPLFDCCGTAAMSRPNQGWNFRRQAFRQVLRRHGRRDAFKWRAPRYFDCNTSRRRRDHRVGTVAKLRPVPTSATDFQFHARCAAALLTMRTDCSRSFPPRHSRW
jgi:hypothetical protein